MRREDDWTMFGAGLLGVLGLDRLANAYWLGTQFPASVPLLVGALLLGGGAVILAPRLVAAGHRKGRAATLGVPRRTCAVCGSTASARGGRRARGRRAAFVCGACYARWERDGRPCGACGLPVRGTQEVGAFVEQRRLGHADCGGRKVSAA